MRRSKMTIFDEENHVGDCIVRQMTNEERQRYGLPLLEQIDTSVRIIPAPKKIIHEEIISEETKIFSEKIKQEIKEKEISQSALSKIIGISPASLGNIINLKHNPKKK